MINVPRTWHLCNNSTLLKMCNEVFQCYRDNGYYFDMPEIYIMKSSVTFGVCRYDRGACEFVIGLNSKYIDEPEKAYSTIIHEFAHCATPKHNHDGVWYRCANTIGRIYGIDINRVDDDGGCEITIHKEPNYKYAVQCPQCKHIWQYERASKVIKNASRCKCPTCNCNIVRIK